MRTGRLAAALLVITAVALVAALPAAGKEGVKATLTANIPLDAEPGMRLKVAWTLTYVDEDARRKPFGANGVFVRLLSASGVGAETGFAPIGAYATGEYATSVVVPEGGIGDVEIGLVGWASDATGTRRSDALFPITNDPVPGTLRVVSPVSEQPGSERTDTGSTTWIFIGVAGSLIAFAVLAVALVRRKHASNGATGTSNRRASAGAS
jgi:hypothetical protein